MSIFPCYRIKVLVIVEKFLKNHELTERTEFFFVLRKIFGKESQSNKLYCKRTNRWKEAVFVVSLSSIDP